MTLRDILAAGIAGALIALPAAAETPAERGAYLVNGLAACGNCHTLRGPDGVPLPGRELAGGPPIAEEGLFVAHPPNITPDVATGIGGWTDEEIVVAIREGRRPDGTIIGPPMPIQLYAMLSDTDVRAIVAYLRTVPAVSNEVPPSTFEIPLPPSYGPPVGSVADVPRTDPVAYGAYLAGPVGHCILCHTPFDETGMMPDFANRLGAGGAPFPGPWGISVSANLTSDVDTGLGAWTDEEIRTAITTGVRRDGTHLLPPMAFDFYANASGEDLAAIVAYLRSLPPIESRIR